MGGGKDRLVKIGKGKGEYVEHRERRGVREREKKRWRKKSVRTKI